MDVDAVPAEGENIILMLFFWHNRADVVGVLVVLVRNGVGW